MKSKAKVLTVASLVVLFFLLLISSCSESNITKSDVLEQNGIATEDIHFVQWNSDAISIVQGLGKTNISEKIFTQKGGELATGAMLGCKLIVPEYAFDEEERLIQASVTSEGNNFAGIEFLPSQQFNKNVKILLPLSAIKIENDADIDDIRAFWYNEETQLWIEISDVVVDKTNQVVYTEIDHFTRFGWGI